MTRKGDPGGLVFVDGPAAGVTISARRAPLLLRIVESDPRSTRPRWDVLDQLHDMPRADERVYVYQAEPGSIFDPEMFMRKTGTFICPTPGAKGTYRHRSDVDGEQLRTIDAWRTWARAQQLPVPAVDGVTLEPVHG